MTPCTPPPWSLIRFPPERTDRVLIRPDNSYATNNLKAREADVENEETQRLKSMVVDLSMSNELLREKIHHLEAGRPLAWRRSKR
jgi:hypothetical protein